MTPIPWFRAEHRPERHEGAGPTVDLIRRGEPATGNPERDLWSDTGCVYGLTVADATALRDSLTAAIEAATPKQEAVKAPRTCWTCRWANGTNCDIDPQADVNSEVGDWAADNIDWVIKMPLPTATPCPGHQDKP